jgi:shikimate kinase
LYLIGMMGTGKTAVGKRVAKRLGRPFLDLDAEIEREEGTPIREIFAGKGEPYFRRRERDLVARAAALQGAVVATGGGAVADPENLKVLKETGTVICLTARPEVIFERTQRANVRPLLQGEDPLVKIQELLEARAEAYARADATIDTTDKSVDEVVEEVINIASRSGLRAP